MSHNEAARVYVAACNREHAECASELVDALNSNTKAVSLGQRSVPLNDIDVLCIAEAIRTLDSDCALRVLNLEENSFGLQGVQALMEALEANPNRIRELRLGKNNLKDQSAVAIGHTLSRGGCGLKVLDLSENGITKLGVIPIAAALQNPSCDIVELSFHNNKIEGDAADFLGEAIRAAPKLKHLHLGYNSLRDTGAMHIAKALPHSNSLSTLDLTANRIGRDGGEALARALLDPICTVQRLNLRHNQLDSETIERFAIVIEKNTSLIQLFLGFMNPTPEVAGAVLRALGTNSHLLLLDIYGWKLSSKVAFEILQGVLHGNGAVAAIVTDACQSIARKIDECNIDREERDLHPIYIGPDDRDAYLATKSLRRYSRAQSRRQSRVSSRARADSRGAFRRRSSRHSETGAEQASSEHASSRRSSRRRSRTPQKTEQGDREASARSPRNGTAAEVDEQPTASHGSSHRRVSRRRKERGGDTPGNRSTGYSAPSSSCVAPLSPHPDAAAAEHHHSHHHSQRAAFKRQQLQVYDAGISKANIKIEGLLEELRQTSSDPNSARVMESIVKTIQSRAQDERAQRDKEMAILLARLEALERRRECQCSGGGVRAAASQQHQPSPIDSNAAYNANNNVAYNSNSNAYAPRSLYNQINSQISLGPPSVPANADKGSGNTGAYSSAAQDPFVRSTSAMGSSSPYVPQYQRPGSAYQRSLSRMSEQADRCQTPLVHPQSEGRGAPPDLAHSNVEPGERKPEEATLQRSASVQNFPPRIEPSPAQDSNPPRRKSVSHLF